MQNDANTYQKEWLQSLNSTETSVSKMPDALWRMLELEAARQLDKQVTTPIHDSRVDAHARIGQRNALEAKVRKETLQRKQCNDNCRNEHTIAHFN